MAVAVGIGLTNECNLACPHCYRPTLTQQRLTVPEVETILDNLDVGSVNLGVGENGVHPEYREMLALLRDRRVKTAITSNGYSLGMLDDEELAGFHSVELSFDFPTKKEMDEFRGEGAWELAVGAVERCAELGIPTSVAAVMMNTNYNEMEEVARFAFGLGCDLRVNVYQPVSGEEFTLSYEQFWQGFANLFAAGSVVVCSEPLVNAIMGLETTRGNPCGNGSIRALPAGTISPCPYWPSAAGMISHLSDGNRNVWESREFRKARRVPEACEPCRFVESCAGGCASRRALRGRLDEPDEYCPVMRGGDEEVRRIREMLRVVMSSPSDVPKAGNACTTVITMTERPAIW
ncbi:radical SAM/SPASM domain-containing protein [Rubrobacter indicoceani]|uniref:radical SAM/SPASM domain-containing protein n=1 Tax=Rubrobacter indicoceani TaxID=2051957 RepID=UPI0013C50EFB|nr:radical SAM protein [Rubrobacter indicoceani]